MRPPRYHPGTALRAAFPLWCALAGCGPRCERPWYPDRDGDGFGDRSEPITACTRPEAHVADADDCDDRAAAVHPGADEACNGIDDDCDGEIDRDAATWYRDLDEDGIGDRDHPKRACSAPDGYVATPGDCDDGDPTVRPGATVELCDGKDQDCDGLVDEEAPGTVTYYPDDDFDGYGDDLRGRVYCAPPAGWIARGGDCDDTLPSISPDATEVCNAGIDDDCDGWADASDPGGVEGLLLLWPDYDQDGFGDPSEPPTTSCSASFYTSSVPTDCDDSDPEVNPQATEVCGGGDEDCDGRVDDADPSVSVASTLTGWPDEDGDGYGAPGPTIQACAFGPGVVTNDEDCDDADRHVGPDWWLPDGDGDGGGAGVPAEGQGCAPPAAGMVNVLAPEDCDDGDPEVRAGLPDPCGDGIDQDCTSIDPPCGAPIDRILDLDEVGRGWATGSAATDAYDVVAVGPDLDGDGFGDAALGAWGTVPTDVLVLSGPGPEVPGPWAPTARVGATFPSFGAAMAIVPDVTGDGLAELVVGHPAKAYGEVQVLSAPGFDTPWMETDGVTAGSQFGAALAFAGDPDLDGVASLVVGAPYEEGAYLLSATAGSGNAATAQLAVSSANDALGTAVAAGSDLDGDGVVEIALGGPDDGTGGTDAGVVYLVSASETGSYAPNAVASGTWWGAAEARLGSALAAGADFDGDGLADLAAGAPGDGGEAGAVFVLAAPASSDADAAAAFRFRGADPQMSVGSAVVLADLDLDGASDLVIGAPGSDLGGTDSGAVYVVYGPAAGSLDTDDADGVLFGAPGSATGAAVAVGPIDADPTPDLWIAQPGLPGGGAWLVPGP